MFWLFCCNKYFTNFYFVLKMYFCIYLQSFLSVYFNQTLAKCHEQTGCLSLSGTEIVRDRPETLSIHGVSVKLHSGRQMP